VGPRGFVFLVALLLVGCASSGGRKKKEEPPPPPDEAALEVPTTVKARAASLVLSERWRKELQVEAIQVTNPAPDRIVARGAAVLTLRKLRVEAGDKIEIRFLADHDNLLLDATEVEFFERFKGYKHRTENVTAVTMANDHVSYFQQ
jgi:hypothetical protein